MTERDQIFADSQTPARPFEFSESVVRVFPDMIERSVPGYRLLLELTPLMVARAAQPDSRIYDLGCSLGAATLAARRAVQADGVEIIAADTSPSMVARCREIIAADNSRVPVEGDRSRCLRVADRECFGGADVFHPAVHRAGEARR
jgi:tRNA (cmo5U34)-methyltransferase